jgi:hypothetical protein
MKTCGSGFQPRDVRSVFKLNCALLSNKIWASEVSSKLLEEQTSELLFLADTEAPPKGRDASTGHTPKKPGFPPARLCRNVIWSLRATAGSVAIYIFPMPYKIASVVSLPRNDITTQSPARE